MFLCDLLPRLARAMRVAPRRLPALALGAIGCAAVAAPAVAAEGYAVQIVSLRSEKAAKDAETRLKERHADLLSDLDMSVQRADLGARGVFFRLQAGPFPNEATAQDMCAQLRAKRLDCLVTRR